MKRTVAIFAAGILMGGVLVFGALGSWQASAGTGNAMPPAYAVEYDIYTLVGDEGVSHFEYSVTDLNTERTVQNGAIVFPWGEKGQSISQGEGYWREMSCEIDEAGESAKVVMQFWERGKQTLYLDNKIRIRP